MWLLGHDTISINSNALAPKSCWPNRSMPSEPLSRPLPVERNMASLQEVVTELTWALGWSPDSHWMGMLCALIVCILFFLREERMNHRLQGVESACMAAVREVRELAARLERPEPARCPF